MPFLNFVSCVFFGFEKINVIVNTIIWIVRTYINNENYLFPLKSKSFPFMYQSTDGSGTPRGGVQFRTTGPPTKATVSLGSSRKSSRNTANKKGAEFQ